MWYLRSFLSKTKKKALLKSNSFAREHFNGGGHFNAAGGRSELSLKDTVKKFINLLPNYQKELVK